MPVLVPFTKITPMGQVLDGTDGLVGKPTITLRVSPEQGEGVPVNGGHIYEKARPVIEGMSDSEGNVLPSIAILKQVRKVDRIPTGVEALLSVRMKVSGFREGLPTKEPYFDLLFTPKEDLVDLSLYEFSYNTELPGTWVPGNYLTYIPPAV